MDWPACPAYAWLCMAEAPVCFSLLSARAEISRQHAPQCTSQLAASKIANFSEQNSVEQFGFVCPLRHRAYNGLRQHGSMRNSAPMRMSNDSHPCWRFITDRGPAKACGPGIILVETIPQLHRSDSAAEEIGTVFHLEGSRMKVAVVAQALSAALHELNQEEGSGRMDESSFCNTFDWHI